MRKCLVVTAFLISIVLLTNLVMAAGSVTITSQVLDSAVRPGGETTVFLTLTNPSTTASVATIRLYITPGPYITSSMSVAEIGGLDASSSQQTALTVKINPEATSTVSYITAKATYYTDSIQRETTVNIPITIRRIPILQLENISYTPSIVEPGNKVLLNFNLKNDGDGSAKDIKIILNQSAQKFVAEGSPEIFVDNIEPKDSKLISFNLVIDPSLDIGTYSIPISLSYLDEIKTSNYSAIKYVGLTVSGKYNFIITQSQTVVAPGKEGSVDLEIANGGNQKALYLTVKILPSDILTQITPSTIYVGNLDSDNYDLEKFTFKVDETALPGVYPLNLQLSYKDPYGKSYNEDAQVDITVSSIKEFSESNSSGSSKFYFVIIIVVIAIIAYFIYKKFKKKK